MTQFFGVTFTGTRPFNATATGFPMPSASPITCHGFVDTIPRTFRSYGRLVFSI